MKRFTLLAVAFVFCGLSMNAQSSCATAQAVTAGTTTVAAVSGDPTPTVANGGCYDASNGTVNDQNADWYSYTSTQDIVVTITTDLASNGTPNETGGNPDPAFYYPILEVLTGTCTTLTCLMADDGASVEVSFLATAGTTYYIAFTDLYSQLSVGTTTSFDFELIETTFNCATSLPFTEDAADFVEFLGCYTVIDNDGNGGAWLRQTLDINGDGTDETFFTNSAATQAGQKDDYLFSPAINLTAGQAYEVVAKFNAVDYDSDGNGPNPPISANEDLEIIIASGNTVADATAGTVVFTQTGITPQGAPDFEANAYSGTSNPYTPSASGDYYVVFHTTSTTPAGFLLLFEYTLQTTAGNDEFAISNFNYFVDDNILNLSANTQMSDIKIHNILGQRVIASQIDSNSAQINISTLKTGVYLGTVSINGQSQTFKFVKR